MRQRSFVVLFRGINVGGNKIVRMETLRKVLSEAGFSSVATYIQSGNVVLTSEADEHGVSAAVASAFARSFGFTSRPTVRSLEAWSRLVAENPFAAAAREDGRRVHAVLLDGEPPAHALEALRALATTERVELRTGVVYLHTPDGLGRSRVAESLDRVLKVSMTARNWAHGSETAGHGGGFGPQMRGTSRLPRPWAGRGSAGGQHDRTFVAAGTARLIDV